MPDPHDTAGARTRRWPRVGALLAALGLAVAALGFALTTVSTSPASADSHVCPEGDGWVKVDGLSGLSYTWDGDVPDGATVEHCYKVGDHPPQFGSGTTVENTSLWNKEGCESADPPNGCNLQDISHASFKVVVPPPQTSPPGSTPPETTPPETTPPETTPPETTPPESTPPESTPPETTPPESTPPGSSPPESIPPPETTPAGAPPPDSPGVPTRIPAGVAGGPDLQAAPAMYEGGSTATTILGRILIGLGLGLVGAGGVVGLQRVRGGHRA